MKCTLLLTKLSLRHWPSIPRIMCFWSQPVTNCSFGAGIRQSHLHAYRLPPLKRKSGMMLEFICSWLESHLRLVFTGDGVVVVVGVVKSGFDLVKIENQSHKQSHKQTHTCKLNGIVVGRNRMVPLSSDSAYDSNTYDQVKNRLQKRKNQPITMPVLRHFDWFILRFCLRLQQSSFHWIVSDRAVSGINILLPVPSEELWLRLRLRLHR